MPSFKNKSIVITGASSGIGEALLRELAKESCQIFIAARSIQKLEKLKSELESERTKIEVLSLDLSSSESLKSAFLLLKNKTDTIDLLINNGGISQRGLAKDTDYDVVKRIMQVNFLGTVEWTSLCMPLLQNSTDSQIAIMSSVVGEYGFPLRSSYAASKHALVGYFESMHLEPDSPRVSIISPGRIRTNISISALGVDGAQHGKMDNGLDKGITPEKAAKKILNGIRKRKYNIFIGSGEIVLLFIKRYVPSLFRFIAKRVSPT
jgi:short-subunit dehydrogenase